MQTGCYQIFQRRYGSISSFSTHTLESLRIVVPVAATGVMIETRNMRLLAQRIKRIDYGSEGWGSGPAHRAHHRCNDSSEPGFLYQKIYPGRHTPGRCPGKQAHRKRSDKPRAELKPHSTTCCSTTVAGSSWACWMYQLTAARPIHAQKPH